LILEIDNLSVEYSIPEGLVKAVNKVSLNLAKGRSLGLAGESGCGKTSLGSAVLRILPEEGKITEGSIKIEGVDLVKLSEEEMRKFRWRDISMVFQGAMNAFDPTMTIENQIAEALLVHEQKIDKGIALERAREMLRLCEINPLLGKSYPHELSGGMKQRACIAMALVLQPKLVIADEITTALDVMIQAQIFRLLRNMKKKFNLSMLIISHDMGVLAENCDQLAIMYAGRLVEIGNTYDIFSNPKHPYVKGLLFSIPRFGGSREVIPAVKGAPPRLLNSSPGCPFRPRCPIAISECETDLPELIPINSHHRVACHRKNYKGDIWHE